MKDEKNILRGLFITDVFFKEPDDWKKAIYLNFLGFFRIILILHNFREKESKKEAYKHQINQAAPVSKNQKSQMIRVSYQNR